MTQSMHDVVIVSAVRTPIGKIGGALSGVRPDDLGALVISEAVKRAGIEAASIERGPRGAVHDGWRGA